MPLSCCGPVCCALTVVLPFVDSSSEEFHRTGSRMHRTFTRCSDPVEISEDKLWLLSTVVWLPSSPLSVAVLLRVFTLAKRAHCLRLIIENSTRPRALFTSLLAVLATKLPIFLRIRRKILADSKGSFGTAPD